VYPGIGWLGFRERSDVPEDLVFYENYLGKRDATFTLNFSTGASMVLARYYNFVRFGQDGYRYVMETMQANARDLARRIAAIGEFRLVGGRTRSSCHWWPTSSTARRTATSSTSPRSSPRSAAGWSPPTRSRPDKGRLHEHDRKRAKSGTGY
jgi:glutamate/tyrosine decarboxylase-like PLP-dependent enzyme